MVAKTSIRKIKKAENWPAWVLKDVRRVRDMTYEELTDGELDNFPHHGLVAKGLMCHDCGQIGELDIHECPGPTYAEPQEYELEDEDE